MYLYVPVSIEKENDFWYDFVVSDHHSRLFWGGDYRPVNAVFLVRDSSIYVPKVLAKDIEIYHTHWYGL